MSDTRASRARIRLVALAVIRDGSRLLVRRYKAPNGDRYYRPLGGAVEFGERAAQTAKRELREEIGAEIENVRHLATLEDLFERNGEPAHQIVFLFDADFVDRSHYTAELIIGTESSGKRIEAVWVDVSQPLDGPLYPAGLADGPVDSRRRQPRRPCRVRDTGNSEVAPFALADPVHTADRAGASWACRHQLPRPGPRVAPHCQLPAELSNHTAIITRLGLTANISPTRVRELGYAADRDPAIQPC